MNEQVKRYDYGYKDDGCGGDRYLGLIEKPDGALVSHSDYAALEAENARLVERTGYLVEFVQQMARQRGEPYYQKLAKAALKKWSGL